MIHIVLDDDQARLFTGTSQTVEIRNRQGAVLGYATHGFTTEEIALALQRQNETPQHTTEEVLKNLAALGRQ